MDNFIHNGTIICKNLTEQKKRRTWKFPNVFLFHFKRDLCAEKWKSFFFLYMKIYDHIDDELIVLSKCVIYP